MEPASPFEIFVVTLPGLEDVAAAEAVAAGFTVTGTIPGGVTLSGGWPEVWRANLTLRGASRVLARIGAFRVLHLAQLDKRAHRFAWADTLRADVPVRVEVTCAASRIYHAGAAKQRIETALTESLRVPLSDTAPVTLKVRIEDDLCTLSVDTSGEPLHRRGFKEAVGKAPLRETMAALFLGRCGYGGDMPVLDPMCGSGTFPIEAAEIAAGLLPGRARSFAFEHLATFDPVAWAGIRAPRRRDTPLRFYGADRDAGAISNARANATRAGVADLITFTRAPISDLARPDGPPGLVMVNPPYGGRIGERKLLFALYGSFGQVLKARFAGWRVGMVTSDPGLAAATGLPFADPGPAIPNGGIKVHLYRTDPLR